MDFLAGLNPAQQEAVRHGEGPLLILAGAGSGKTRVITHRIAHLIGSRRIPASAILAVTFTNKAAEEMAGRVAALLGEAHLGNRPWVSTFHSFCVRLLRRDGASLATWRPGFTTAFTIYDEDDQLAVVKAVFRRHGLDEKFMPYRAVLSRISFAKNHQQTPADLYQASTDPRMSRLALVYEEYEDRLRQANALDFDDLLLETVRLLRQDETVRRRYNERFRFLLIDEYQDTNRTQYELVRLLSEQHRNVCAVGDEDQSIYGWRGADIRNILDFERDFPEARIIRLEQNYRSTGNILEAASAVVARNTQRIGKWLWTEAPPGERIGLFEAADGEQEALFIADTIERLFRADPHTRVAVLYRTNAQSRQIEEALRRYGRNYLVVGGFSFYQRAEIKDVLAYLKLLLAPRDSVSLLRIINTPARGIGKTTVEQIERYAGQHGLSLWDAIEQMLRDHLLPLRAAAALQAFRNLIQELREAAASQTVDAVLRLILERTGYLRMLEDGTPESETRRENLEELVNAAAEAAERGEDIAAFLDHAALVSEADSVDERAQVLLLTLHNAKGLEFPVVFIAGMEEGLFPHMRSLQDPALLEEERRLCYVGMTRAQKRLILTWARERRRFAAGEPEARPPSRFLAEVPPHLTEDLSAPAWAGPDLFVESFEVRRSAQRAAYPGKTYNSVEHIREFFAARNRGATPAPRSAPAPVLPSPAPRRLPAPGVTVRHPRYGRGTVLRKEGDGDDAKLTIHFPGYGLKKLIQKHAGLSIEE
ncbi:MAG: UvrD-helicase domain-containing protein [Bryobacterales bacterium]|nr:UvrD-helicase domain-containing protein [Bryobacteraceae bacterium]MDW8352901.1 UvrD-helicase domain-containing protein [Bryobacterales bacterium]